MGGNAGQHSRNFIRSKNCEDGSDFNDFWINRLAAVPAKFAKLLCRRKTFREGGNTREIIEKVILIFRF